MTAVADSTSVRSIDPAPPMPATVRETHSAYVFMVGDVAYKMKKPIRTDFLDFRSVDSRWVACDREFTLNSRFAPDVYLGIAELTDLEGGPAEPLLKMRRLPDSTRLSTRALAGENLSSDLNAVARVIASAHRSGPRSARIDHEGHRTAIAQRWQDNIDEMRTVAIGVVDMDLIENIAGLASNFISGRSHLFEHRIAQGRVVDGHGDLLADDIFCLPDGPRILDCLDFDDHLRFIDGIDDVACLAMDLEYLGRPDAARFFLDSYVEAAADSPPRSLIDHYIAYRALVRAKVACIRFGQGHTTSKDDARAHLRLALAHLQSSSVTVTLIGGLPGTGKSTLAAALSKQTGALVLSRDVVRKELAGLDPHDRRPADIRSGLYTHSVTTHTYAELLRRAREFVSMGRSVILDASWTDPEERRRVRTLATLAHTDLREYVCRAPERIALDRVESRPPGPSDASPDVYDAMARNDLPWPEATVIDTVIDTGIDRNDHGINAIHRILADIG